jgi:serine/threonine protein kinase
MQNTETRLGERGSRPHRRVDAPVCGWLLERPLARGPVCESWLASHGAELGVVRVLGDRFAAYPHACSEWLRASWAASRFHHPSVVPVIDHGTDERGAPAMVRGWVDGETLEEAWTRGALDPTFVLHIAESLLDALEMAHAHGIVHGALTPSNLLLDRHGAVHLVDFAASPGRRGQARAHPDVLAEARVGRFTAPELRSRPTAPPSESSDVWSVGACLYGALTGTGEEPDDTFRGAVEELTRRWKVREDIAAVVGYALSSDPGDRYGSAYAMLGDVRRLLTGRKPKLFGARAPVPSQSLARRAELPPSPSPPVSEPLPQRAASEWRGNILLMIAIALLVGLATFVMVRERLSDGEAIHRTLTR